MNTVDFTPPECVVLEQILENKVNALANELAHTDDRSYRQYVKETIATVEQLQAKLETSFTRGQERHS